MRSHAIPLIVALLINVQRISKSYGANPLFQDLSLSIDERTRLGVIGPNGSGKSTLLRILTGSETPDSGEVVTRKATRVAYVEQDSQFSPGESVIERIRRAMDIAKLPETERAAQEAETLGRAGFENFEAEAATLSGGWRKRLAIAEALVTKPEILFLDEPTNHLDIAGIRWLEELLRNASFACVLISHDRYFLENVPTAMAELNRVYPDGMFYVAGNYSAFLEKKSEFLHAQSKRQEALENRVKTEMEWLRRGPKARATKAKARIDAAHEMIGELADLRSRSRAVTADIDFTATERKTKRLIHLENVSAGFNGTPLFKGLDLALTAGTRIGLVGANGSGKTTLLKVMQGELPPVEGKMQQADSLRIVYFDQTRQLNPEVTLKRALAPDSDSVVYRDQVIHVASWASRFLFQSDQLNQPVAKLSGGERARVLIAKLMLEPADVLILDEPTNDLDIPTLEILEESLLEFPGALVLVTHDRYLLDRVSTVVLGLDGEGSWERFADYSQWEQWQVERKNRKPKPAAASAPVRTKPTSKKKLSYQDEREHAGMEQRIAAAEQILQTKHFELETALLEAGSDRSGRRLEQAHNSVEMAQREVDALYARWAELEEKANSQ